MENFFQRLEVYIEVVPTPEMMDLIMKIMVEVLTVLAIATKEIKQGRTSKLFMHGYVAADGTIYRAISEEGYREARC
jgi:predicted transcriptional regulator